MHNEIAARAGCSQTERMISRRSFLAASAALATPAFAAAPRIRFGQIGTQHAHAAGKMEALRRLSDLYEVVGLAADEGHQGKA